MDPYAEARAIDPDLFDSYGETGRYHLRRPTTDKPSKEEMKSASARLEEAREQLKQLNKESSEALLDAHLNPRRPYEENYARHNELENDIIPEKEYEIRMIESQYAWYRYEQALQAFKDHIEYHYERPKKRSRGGMKRRRKTRR